MMLPESKESHGFNRGSMSILVETDPESEEDHLVVVRKPKQLAGIMRGDIFEYLVAQYI